MPDPGPSRSSAPQESQAADGPASSTNRVIRATFNPPADTATFRDLLLFEERLKMNAEVLRRRRRRYSIFLWSFVIAFLIFFHRWLFLPPTTYVMLRALQAGLAVILITLILFFASGMFDEKIRYAHSYITHSNKALRPLNMHLNLRRPSILTSLYAWLPPSLRPSPALSAPVPPFPGPGARAIPLRRPSTTVMAQIPPTTNPRGELIFSSRVAPKFKEGYERYRAAFERRREEKAREARGAGKWWTRGGTPTPPISRRGTPPLGTHLDVNNAAGSGRDHASGTDGATGRTTPGSRRGRTPSPASSLRHEERESKAEREQSNDPT